MRVIRYEDARGVARYGAVQADGTTVRIVGDIFGAFQVTAEPAIATRLLAPVVPSNILCIGRNYRRQSGDGQAPPEHPIVFMKATTSVQDPGGPIVLPRRLRSDQVNFECELAVVIGRHCRNVNAADALDYVLGYTCANDVGARDWQERCGGQWWRGKSFDTFAPLGPSLALTDDIPDPSVLGIRAMLNGSATHDGRASDMFFGVPELVAFLSGDTTLLPGTVILTGCPPRLGTNGSGPLYLRPGDSVTVEVDGIGSLTNPVVEGA
jgi:2-keto-4-pentenoate hydratase/2-oxohepta-3-ene-1,7-dioic acid hydratase in catechol pathway